jgi:hypothetical protein
MAFVALAPPGYALIHVTTPHKTSILFRGFPVCNSRSLVLLTPEMPIPGMPKCYSPWVFSFRDFGIPNAEMRRCLVLRISGMSISEIPTCPFLWSFTLRAFGVSNTERPLSPYPRNSQSLEPRYANLTPAGNPFGISRLGFSRCKTPSYLCSFSLPVSESPKYSSFRDFPEILDCCHVSSLRWTVLVVSRFRDL